MIESLDLPALPEGWVWTKLGDIGEIASGGTPSTKVYTNFDGDISWITPADLSGFDGKFIARGRRNLSEKGLNSSSATLLPAGTVLYSSRAPIGYVAIATSNISTNQGFKNIVLGKHIFNEYVYYYLKGSKKLAESFASGTTFSELSAKRFSQLPIPFPPLPEQHRIVAKIEELFTKQDAGVKSLEKTKAQLKRYRQAVLKYAFEGKLTEEWRERHKNELEPASELIEQIKEERKKNAKGKYKERPPRDTSELPELPEGWVWTKLDIISSKITDGEHIRPKVTAKGIPFLSAKDVRDVGVVFNDLLYIAGEDAIKFRQRCNPDLGDILIVSRGATVGRSCIVNTEKNFCLLGSVILIKLYPELLNKFISYTIKSSNIQRQLINLSGSTAQQAIYLRDIKKISIAIPPLVEQHKIVEEIERRFSVADEVGRTVEHSLKQSERLRQSILKGAFKGKLVPQDPIDEPASILLERIKEKRKNREIEGKSRSKIKQRRFNDYVE